MLQIVENLFLGYDKNTFHGTKDLNYNNNSSNNNNHNDFSTNSTSTTGGTGMGTNTTICIIKFDLIIIKVFFFQLFQATIPEEQSINNSIIERTITEEMEEEDKISTNITPAPKGSGQASTSRDRGATISIKINGHMRDVVVPHSVTANR